MMVKEELLKTLKVCTGRENQLYDSKSSPSEYVSIQFELNGKFVSLTRYDYGKYREEYGDSAVLRVKSSIWPFAIEWSDYWNTDTLPNKEASLQWEYETIKNHNGYEYCHGEAPKMTEEELRQAALKSFEDRLEENKRVKLSRRRTSVQMIQQECGISYEEADKVLYYVSLKLIEEYKLNVSSKETMVSEEELHYMESKSF